MPIPVLTGAAMRHADEDTISNLGIPGFALMEIAGRGATAAIEDFTGPLAQRHVVVLCGKGNNGGDGLAVARQLCMRNARITVILIGQPDELSPDAASNLKILRRLVESDPSLQVDIKPYEPDTLDDMLADADVVVDALLGTGIESDLKEPIRSIVESVNRAGSVVASVDIATGLSTDTGRVLGAAVKADLTVTMAALKVGHLLNDGPVYSGRVEVVQIGIPRSTLEKSASMDGCAWIATDDEVSRWFKPRSADAHKYSAGTVVAAVGSKSFPGAAVMAVSAASRIGAGYVICGVPKSIQETLSSRLTDVTILPLNETVDGGIASDARQGMEERLNRATALLVGCGVGRDPDTLAFVRDLVATSELPGVIDADGLHAFAGDKQALRRPSGSEWILTPHWGELKVLTGDEHLDRTDQIRVASRFAAEWGCVLILKGMPSVVACPDGRVFVNPTGNTGLATAGTGDVLAGFCAGLLAQGLSPVEAAVAGLHIGGAAADLFASRADSRTMVAMDLVDLIPETVKARFQTVRPS
ncbi:MAG TPA: NAD(P)H-hydrate dehydratase [Rhodothermales bacterium]|nr:NAD(P)H-hydrate dehydratase [Rhodothermales bacterium]